MKDHSQGDFKKGVTYTVRVIEYIKLHGSWAVELKKVTIADTGVLNLCRECFRAYQPGDHPHYNARAFAPLTSTFRTISYERVLELEQPTVGTN